MSRKVWIAVIVIVMVGVLVAGAGVAALILVPRYRSQHNIAQARKHAAAGEWDLSRRHYQEYLYKNDSDLKALEEYIKVCEAFETDRRRSLLAAGRAYVKLAQKEPEVPARKQAVLDFYRNYRFWPELEYAISLFYGSDRDLLDADLAYDRAVAIQLQGRDAAAVEEFEAYLGIQGGRKDAPLRDAPLHLARLYRDQGKERDAEALFVDLMKEHPEDGLLHAYQAGYLMDGGRVDEAREALAKVPESDQGTLDFTLAAARLATLEGKAEDALSYAKRALEDDPDSVDAHLNYTMALERSGRRDEAEAYIEAMDPLYRLDTPGFMMFLIEMKLDDAKVEEADAIREVYARAYPDQRFLDEYLKGRIAFAEGRNDPKFYEEARDRFVMAVEMNPNLDRARYFLAITQLELGDKSAARIALEAYLKNNPADEQARRLWARNFDAAKSILELRFSGKRLLESEAPQLEALLFTAQDLMAHHRAEDEELTRGLLEKAVAVAPTDAQGYSALAAFYLDRDQVDEAVQVLAKAASAGIDQSAFPLLNTNILLARGDVEAALRIARETLAEAEFSDVRTWATFFARHQYLREGGILLDEYMNRAGDEATAVVLPFRLSLTLRFGTEQDARTLLETAEVSLSGDPERVKSLNAMRLTFARSLMGRKPLDNTAIEALLQKVESSDPNEDGLLVARARLALTQELPDYEKAAAAVSGLSEDSDSYDDAQLLLAEIAYRRGRYEEVAEIAQKVVDRSEENTGALYLLSEAFLGMRKSEDARDTLERILEIDRGDLRALRLLVRVYSDMQLPRKAETTLKRYEELAANDPSVAASAAELRAYLARSEGELAESEAQLRQQLADDPDNYSAMTGLVRALVGQGQFEEGIKLAEAYLERNPHQADPWVFLGQVILEQGEGADLAKASTAFTRAQIAVPEHGAAQLGLVDVQIRMNHIELAVSMCRRYLKNRPDDTDVLFRLASLLSRDPKDCPEALEAVQRAIALGERPEYIRLRAFLYTRLARPADAVADLERLKSLTDRLTPDDDLTLAEAYIGLGDLEKARASLAEARSKAGGTNERLSARIESVNSHIASPGASQ